ncbi:MAG TPA: hypothetical protein VGY76_10715 [Solirubrobacteraceae bacterium]|jgi:hypothetical protein|nr:hypothetical protein [Solirubrobacteraceae bacterium]
MTSEIEQVPERWRYLGRRETRSGRLGAMWKTSDGEELLFAAKRPPKVVGGIYEVTVHRNPGAISIGASPTFMEAPDGEDTGVAKWEAEDRAAVTADALRKAEAKAYRSSLERFGELTLAELREIYLRQPRLRGAALIGQVLRYIGAA